MCLKKVSKNKFLLYAIMNWVLIDIMHQLMGTFWKFINLKFDW